MDSFTIIIPITFNLYHATEQQTFTMINKPMWFAHEPKRAEAYATNILKFNPRRELKLIDISNQIFHMDFIAKVNNASAPLISTSRFDSLIPLGLPDLVSQLKTIDYQQNGIYPGATNDDKMLKAIETFAPLFGNKHRFSQLNSTSNHTDHVMVDTLFKLYPNYDGYTCLNFWPSYHHGGFMIPETCLFKPFDVTEKTQVGSKKNKTMKKQNGGGRGMYPHYFDLEEMAKKMGKTFDDLVVVNSLIYTDP